MHTPALNFKFMKIINSTSLLVLAFLAMSFSSAPKQQEDPMTWLGIDYSAAKFIGAAGFTDPQELPTIIQAWNDFVLTEPKKYNVDAALGSSDVTIDLALTNAKNKDLSPEDMIQEDEHTLTEAQVREVAAGYDLSGIQGVAVLLVAESYNKKLVEGSHWVVKLDAQRGEIQSVERYVAKPRGFGLRNYWAYTIYQTMVKMEKEEKKKK